MLSVLDTPPETPEENVHNESNSPGLTLSTFNTMSNSVHRELGANVVVNSPLTTAPQFTTNVFDTVTVFKLVPSRVRSTNVISLFDRCPVVEDSDKPADTVPHRSPFVCSDTSAIHSTNVCPLFDCSPVECFDGVVDCRGDSSSSDAHNVSVIFNQHPDRQLRWTSADMNSPWRHIWNMRTVQNSKDTSNDAIQLLFDAAELIFRENRLFVQEIIEKPSKRAVLSDQMRSFYLLAVAARDYASRLATQQHISFEKSEAIQDLMLKLQPSSNPPREEKVERDISNTSETCEDDDYEQESFTPFDPAYIASDKYTPAECVDFFVDHLIYVRDGPRFVDTCRDLIESLRRRISFPNRNATVRLQFVIESCTNALNVALKVHKNKRITVPARLRQACHPDYWAGT